MKKYFATIWRTLSLSKSVQLGVMRLLHDRFLISATGVIFNEKEEILLFKHTYRTMQWGLPGGYINAREHPMEALEREVHEESGLVVSADEQLKIRTDRESSRLEICLIGTHIGGEFTPSDEVSEAGFFPFGDLPLLGRDQLFLIKEAIDMKSQKTKPQEPYRKKQERMIANVRKFFAR